MKRILGPNTKKVTEGWRKLHNDDLQILYCSSNIIKVKLEEHVARMGSKEMCTTFQLQNLKERYCFRGLGVDERIILI